MQRFVLSMIAVLVAASFLSVPYGWGSERTVRASRSVNVEIAIHYDFYLVKGVIVSDASGKNHSGTIHHGEIVYGRNKNAIKLDGDGWIAMANVPASLNLESQPFTVGAYCQPMAADGVVVTMGDKTNGFSLYLKKGVPHFVVRSGGELLRVAADQPVVMNQWIHLAGAVDNRGKLWLIVNTWPTAATPGKLIEKCPSKPFCVGADIDSPVGDYSTPMHWKGLIQNIRLYRGFLDRNEYRDQWQAWANRPDCCGRR